MNTTYSPSKASPTYARPSSPTKHRATPAEMMSTEMSLPSHPIWTGYVFWILGFFGTHRFFYGKPITGTIWFFTGGLFLIGWIIDIFLIPSMSEEASRRYPNGPYDYSATWLLQVFLGLFGIHRFYLGKFISGLVWLLTGGLFGIGYIYDTLTLNETIDEANRF